jgi:predicted AlkP superfamily phosphohydrolase/phosphomutase
MATPDPETGESLVDKVWFRENLFSGPYLDLAPDILYAPTDERAVIFGDFEFSSNRVVEPTSPAISGQHRMDGILALWGPEVPAGTVLERAGIMDVAPTALHLMGMPVPEDMDGRVIIQALKPDFLERRPVQSIGGDEQAPTDAAPGYTEEQEGEIIDRLKGLGYIS